MGERFILTSPTIPVVQRDEIAEDLLRKTTQEVFRYYYDFGKTLSKQYDHYRELKHGDLAAQALVTDDVRKQLPKDTSEEALRKRTERFMVSSAASIWMQIGTGQ